MRDLLPYVGHSTSGVADGGAAPVEPDSGSSKPPHVPQQKTTEGDNVVSPPTPSSEAFEQIAASPALEDGINRALLEGDFTALTAALAAYDQAARAARMRSGPTQPRAWLTSTVIGEVWIVKELAVLDTCPNIAASGLPIFTLAELALLATQGAAAIHIAVAAKRAWPTATVLAHLQPTGDADVPSPETTATPVGAQLPLFAEVPDAGRAPLSGRGRQAAPKPAEPPPPPGTTGTLADGYFCPHIDAAARQAEWNRGRTVYCHQCWLARPKWRPRGRWFESIAELKAYAESLRHRRKAEEDK